MGERVGGIDEVEGSIPSGSTTSRAEVKGLPLLTG